MIEISALSKHWTIEPQALQGIQTFLRESQTRLSLFSEQPMQNTQLVSVRNGIAVISIHGIITARADIFTFLMGGTPLDLLAKEFQKALNDDEIKAILFDIDSPGGVATGPAEMAEIIFNARKKKPIWAYIGRNGCSAAYWLASAAENIVAHKSALVGSVGVVSTIPIQEKPDKDGYRQIEVVSNNAKNKRPDPRTPEGLEEVRRELNCIECEFITAIANYRGLTPEYIQQNFGQGGVLIGAEAVKANMIDMLGSYESVITTLIQTTNPMTNKGVKIMSDKENTVTTDHITTEFLSRERPELYKAIKDEGAKAERERLAAIDKISMAGHEDLITAAKNNPEMTAEKLAVQIIAAEKAKGSEYISSLREAAKTMPDISPSATIMSEQLNSQGATPEERAENEWKANGKIRAEFGGDKEAFMAFYTANEKGLVKLQNK